MTPNARTPETTLRTHESTAEIIPDRHDSVYTFDEDDLERAIEVAEGDRKATSVDGRGVTQGTGGRNIHIEEPDDHRMYWYIRQKDLDRALEHIRTDDFVSFLEDQDGIHTQNEIEETPSEFVSYDATISHEHILGYEFRWIDQSDDVLLHDVVNRGNDMVVKLKDTRSGTESQGE